MSTPLGALGSLSPSRFRVALLGRMAKTIGMPWRASSPHVIRHDLRCCAGACPKESWYAFSKCLGQSLKLFQKYPIKDAGARGVAYAVRISLYAFADPRVTRRVRGADWAVGDFQRGEVRCTGCCRSGRCLARARWVFGMRPALLSRSAAPSLPRD